MGAATIVLLIILVAAVLPVLYFIGVYNKLVQLRNRFKNAFAQIDVQLKRRYDLIPNLVETARGYLTHERDTLEGVIAARNQAASAEKRASAAPDDPEAISQLIGAESVLASSLGRLFALVEAYPDLKANQNMMQLSEELRSTENKVAFARQAFNDSVTLYNTYKQTVPPVIFAPMFGHAQDAAMLEFDSAQIQEPPKVSF